MIVSRISPSSGTPSLHFEFILIHRLVSALEYLIGAAVIFGIEFRHAGRRGNIVPGVFDLRRIDLKMPAQPLQQVFTLRVVIPFDQHDKLIPADAVDRLDRRD